MNSSKLIEHYTKLYEYQEDDFRNSNLQRMLLKHVCGHRILEIGCGTGHLTLAILKRGCHVTAIDILPQMLEFTRRTTKRYHVQARVMQLRVEELHKLNSPSFDTVLCIDVLEHIEDDTQALKAISEKLNDKGKLLLIVPAHKCLYGIRDREMGHLRRYNRKEIRRKMMRCGYTILKMRSWNFLGVIPYFISEKIFKRRVNERVRYSRRKPLAAILNLLLSKWFALVENHLSFGIGLSLFIVAGKSRLKF